MFQISRRSASAVNDFLTQLRTNTNASVWLTQLGVAEIVRAASSAIDIPLDWMAELPTVAAIAD
jgi:hypothetical protein